MDKVKMHKGSFHHRLSRVRGRATPTYLSFGQSTPHEQLPKQPPIKSAVSCALLCCTQGSLSCSFSLSSRAGLTKLASSRSKPTSRHSAAVASLVCSSNSSSKYCAATSCACSIHSLEDSSSSLGTLPLSVFGVGGIRVRMGSSGIKVQGLPNSGAISIRRRHAPHVCQLKKSKPNGLTSIKPRKKTSGGTASMTVSTSVRKSLVEEVMKEEMKSSGGSSNIVPAGALSRTSRQERALVLDSAYRPINVWSWSKAVMMDVLQRCDVIEYYPPPAHALSGRGLHKLPAVVRVETYIDVSDLCQQVSCTPRNVLMRDKFCCQYCGSKQHLTLDHIVPISKGGKNTWSNLITACTTCNQRKGDKLLSQLGWKLLGPPPREPKPYEVGFVAGLRIRDLVRPPEVWNFFLEPYRKGMEGLLDHMTSDDFVLDEDAEAS